MSWNEFGFSVVLSGLFTMPLSLAPPACTVVPPSVWLRRYNPPARAAPAAAAPVMNLRLLRYAGLGVISGEAMSLGFFISMSGRLPILYGLPTATSQDEEAGRTIHRTYGQTLPM